MNIEWYTGLSKLFLSVTAPKLLLLAGTDRLDQELTIGQMQGKFQMSLLPQAGHVIQEDVRIHCIRLVDAISSTFDLIDPLLTLPCALTHFFLF